MSPRARIVLACGLTVVAAACSGGSHGQAGTGGAAGAGGGAAGGSTAGVVHAVVGRSVDR